MPELTGEPFAEMRRWRRLTPEEVQDLPTGAPVRVTGAINLTGVVEQAGSVVRVRHAGGVSNVANLDGQGPLARAFYTRRDA